MSLLSERFLAHAVNPAVLSLAALILALALSMSSRINVGWLALAFAWLIGVYKPACGPTP